MYRIGVDDNDSDCDNNWYTIVFSFEIFIVLSDGLRLTGGRDQGKEQFPGQGQEVHDVVSAGWHLLLGLLSLFSFLIVI